MAVQAAPQGNGKAVADDKKRADGPVKISYVGADGVEHDRVSADVAYVKVLDRKANKAKNYPVDKVSPQMRVMLTALALGKRFDITARNAVKADADASVINTSDELFTNILAGKFSSRGEGKGGPGRTFDTEMWVSIFKAAYAMKRKSMPKLPAWGDAQTAKFTDKLTSMDGKERNKYLNAQQSNDPTIKLAATEYKLAKQQEAVKAGPKSADNFADLF